VIPKGEDDTDFDTFSEAMEFDEMSDIEEDGPSSLKNNFEALRRHRSTSLTQQTSLLSVGQKNERVGSPPPVPPRNGVASILANRKKVTPAAAPTRVSQAEFILSMITKPNDAGAPTLCKMLDDGSFERRRVNEVVRNSSESPACSLLHIAAKANNVECMQVLMNNGAIIDSKDSIEATPLHYACSSGANEAVVFLLMNGANVHAKDTYDTFPLLLALKRDYLSIARMLILNQADVHLKGKRGNTALHTAASNGNVNHVDILAGEFNASLLRVNDSHESVLFCALANPPVVHKICDHANNSSILGKLVAMKNNKGRTVFHECCEKGYLESLLTILESLCNKASDIAQIDSYLDQKLNELSTDGFSPLHCATIAGRYQIIQFLVTIKNVHIHKVCARNHSPLHYAITYNYSNVAQLLTTVLTDEQCTDVEKKKMKAVSRLRASLSRASVTLSKRLSTRFPLNHGNQENI